MLSHSSLRFRLWSAVVLTGWLLLAVSSAPADLPRFEAVTIDDAVCEVACYAVAIADVDGDGLDDIVAVNERQVLWYRNPDWTKHVIIEDQTARDNVCIAPLDIDGDGQIDFALGAGWTRTGTIQWLARGESLDEPWKVYFIGEEPWLHRMRFANVLGLERQQLVVSPLNATQGEGVRLMAFAIPDNPRQDRWPVTLMDDSLNRMHNHWHLDLNQDGLEATLVAAQEGLFLLRRDDQGLFTRRQVGSGHPGETPDTSGAGEVKTGRLSDGRLCMASIEPMHGHSVVLYTTETPQLPPGTLADRLVLDDTLRQGHGLWLADLDGQPGDEIIAGHREPGEGDIRGPGIYLYTADDQTGRSWTKHVLDDGGMAVEDLICWDLDGDGDIDIVAGGRATRNLKIYWNQLIP